MIFSLLASYVNKKVKLVFDFFVNVMPPSCREKTRAFLPALVLGSVFAPFASVSAEAFEVPHYVSGYPESALCYELPDNYDQDGVTPNDFVYSHNMIIYDNLDLLPPPLSREDVYTYHVELSDPRFQHFILDGNNELYGYHKTQAVASSNYWLGMRPWIERQKVFDFDLDNTYSSLLDSSSAYSDVYGGIKITMPGAVKNLSTCFFSIDPALDGFTVDMSNTSVASSYYDGVRSGMYLQRSDPNNVRLVDLTGIDSSNQVAVDIPVGPPPVNDDDLDGITNEEDPAPTDPCDPNLFSVACLNSTSQLPQQYIPNDSSEIIASLDPFFSIYEASNPFEPLQEGDQVAAGSAMGYNMTMVDPNRWVSSVDLVIRSSCRSDGLYSWNYHPYSDFPYSDTNNHIKSLSVDSLDGLLYPSLSTDTLPTTCNDQVFASFRFVDNREVLFYIISLDSTPLANNPQGIFGSQFDISLAPGTPGFFVAIYKGISIPFTGIQIGVEPVMNFFLFFAQYYFNLIFESIPILSDFYTILAPPPGTPIVQPTDLLGKDFDFVFLDNSPTVLYLKHTEEYYSTVDVIVKFLIFFWFLFSFLSLFGLPIATAFEDHSGKSGSEHVDRHALRRSTDSFLYPKK